MSHRESIESRAPAVVIVGGGASGLLSAAQLARTADATGTALRLVLIEPGEPGHGVAYSTTDPQHRLNVPARGMSAWPEDSEHFLRWLHHRVDEHFSADAFAPRYRYAQYLRETLAQSLRESPGVRWEHVSARARSIRPAGRGLEVITDSGIAHVAAAVVLATGNGAPGADWAPPALRASRAFVADPWSAPEPAAEPDANVLLVGAGLTMADQAMRVGARGAQLHVVSRHGMLPLPHASTPPPVTPPQFRTDREFDAADLRRAIFAHIRDFNGDWRRAIDSLRPVTARLWTALPAHERVRLIASSGRRWDRARHRVPPEVGAWLRGQQIAGRLTVHAASVTGAHAHPSGAVSVTLSSGAAIHADRVINCTGPGATVLDGTNPLLSGLVDSGLARPGPLGLGVATLHDGRVTPVCGETLAMWALGPLRRGELWESTAIPEIRVQAADLARAVFAQLTPEHPALVHTE